MYMARTLKSKIGDFVFRIGISGNRASFPQPRSKEIQDIDEYNQEQTDKCKRCNLKISELS